MKGKKVDCVKCGQTGLDVRQRHDCPAANPIPFFGNYILNSRMEER